MVKNRIQILFLFLCIAVYASQEVGYDEKLMVPAMITEVTDDAPEDVVKSKEEEERIQQLAVATVANMAHSIITIGNAHDDSQVVAREVANIVGSFASFVMQAMKHPTILELLEDEELTRSVYRSLLTKRNII